MWAWGFNAYGQLGDGTTTTRANAVQVSGLTGVINISTGAYHSGAVKSGGTVWAWGLNNSGQLGFSIWRLKLGDKELAKNDMSDADANEFAEILVAMGQGYALLLFFLGIIYPLIVVIVLTRPSARAACSVRSVPPT